MKQTHILVDLETLGTRPGCIIASIGAVKFDLNGIKGRFYERINIEEAQKERVTMDASTVKWWLKQSQEAREELTNSGGLTTAKALSLFSCFVNDSDPCVWGNGASFDNALLSAAYLKLGIPQPWKFWNDRCYRTVKALHPDKPMQKRTGTHHNALDDAISQAEHLITLPSFRAMEGGGK